MPRGKGAANEPADSAADVRKFAKFFCKLKYPINAEVTEGLKTSLKRESLAKTTPAFPERNIRVWDKKTIGKNGVSAFCETPFLFIASESF
ncbi:MAG: hypothetical protein DBX55_07390 [Verrucomicrobia bacterium]|nr:MAG: hypothetical protein DBX55_07390 [Verrucomicrobiota bacterium]